MFVSNSYSEFHHCILPLVPLATYHRRGFIHGTENTYTIFYPFLLTRSGPAFSDKFQLNQTQCPGDVRYPVDTTPLSGIDDSRNGCQG